MSAYYYVQIRPETNLQPEEVGYYKGLNVLLSIAVPHGFNVQGSQQPKNIERNSQQPEKEVASASMLSSDQTELEFHGRIGADGYARFVVPEGLLLRPLRAVITGSGSRIVHRMHGRAPEDVGMEIELIYKSELPETIFHKAPRTINKTVVSGRFSCIGTPRFDFSGYTLTYALMTDDQVSLLGGVMDSNQQNILDDTSELRSTLISMTQQLSLSSVNARLSSQGDFTIEVNHPVDEVTGSHLAWALVGPQLAVGVINLPDTKGAKGVFVPLLIGADKNDDSSLAEPCDCNSDAAPFDVSEADLLRDPSLYADDIGSTCRPFSKANRIVSEKAFHTIIRVDQPEIGHRDQFNISGRKQVDVNTVALRKVLGDDNIDWDDSSPDVAPLTVTGGHVIEYRVRWRSNGYSLGDVAYTTTLAPRQTKHLTQLNWKRRDRNMRYETTNFSDSADQIQSFNRDFDASVSANLAEWSLGGSTAVQHGNSLGIGGMAKGVIFGGGSNTSVAASASSQVGNRSVTAHQQDQLRDSLRQHAEALRSVESTIVTETEQAESNEGVSEIIRNPNYCHSLTVMYYQILRHLRVDTQAVNVRECIFVPLAVRPLSAKNILRWRHVLQNAVSDLRLRKAFDDIEEVLNSSTDAPENLLKEPLVHVQGEINLRLKIERPTLDADVEPSLPRERNLWGAFTDLLDHTVDTIAGWMTSGSDAEQANRFVLKVAPTMARRFINRLSIQLGVNGRGDNNDNNEPAGTYGDFTMRANYQPGASHKVYFSLNTEDLQGKTLSDIEAIKISPSDALPRNSVANIEYLRLNWRSKTRSGVVNVRQRSDDLVQDDGSVEAFEYSSPLHESVISNPLISKSALVNELVDHINTHLMRYQKMIWWSLDRDLLYTMLDAYEWVVPGSDEAVSLASICGRDPLGIVGNALVFPVAAGNHIRVGNIEARDELLEKYLGDTEPAEPIRLSLPTDGLYARAIMDECNACEEHAGSTDWVLSDELKELALLDPSTMTSRYQTPQELTPTEADTIINFGQMPTPPTADYGAALNAVQNAGAFRDMTGLDGTQNMAMEAAKNATDQANQFGKMGLNFGQTKMQHQQAMSKLNHQQFDKKAAAIKKMIANGDISPEIGKKALEDLVTGLAAPDKVSTGKENQAAKIIDGQNNPATTSYSYEDGEVKETLHIQGGQTNQGQSYIVPGLIKPMAQPSSMTCWASAMAILVAWRFGSSLPMSNYTVAGFVSMLAPQWAEMFHNNKGINTEEKADIIDFIGLKVAPEGLSNMLPEGWLSLLQAYGLLWVTVSVGNVGSHSAHALVLYGITIAEDPLESEMLVIDPSTGKRTTLKYAAFQEKYEQVAASVAMDKPVIIQIVHWNEKVPEKQASNTIVEGKGVPHKRKFDKKKLTVLESKITNDEDEQYDIVIHAMRPVHLATANPCYDTTFLGTPYPGDANNTGHAIVELRLTLADGTVHKEILGWYPEGDYGYMELWWADGEPAVVLDDSTHVANVALNFPKGTSKNKFKHVEAVFAATQNEFKTAITLARTRIDEADLGNRNYDIQKYNCVDFAHDFIKIAQPTYVFGSKYNYFYYKRYSFTPVLLAGRMHNSVSLFKPNLTVTCH